MCNETNIRFSDLHLESLDLALHGYNLFVQLLVPANPFSRKMLRSFLSLNLLHLIAAEKLHVPKVDFQTKIWFLTISRGFSAHISTTKI